MAAAIAVVSWEVNYYGCQLQTKDGLQVTRPAALYASRRLIIRRVPDRLPQLGVRGKFAAKTG
jgi:hypothetical protein